MYKVLNRALASLVACVALVVSCDQCAAASVIYSQTFDDLPGGPTSSNQYVDAASVLPVGTTAGKWQFRNWSWTSETGSGTTSNEGLIELTRNFAGSGSSGSANPAVLILHDAQTDGDYSLNEAILTVNLNGFTDITLSFREYDSSDEEHAMPSSYSDSTPGSSSSSRSNNPRADGVSVSSNGIDWFTIYNPPNHDESWRTIGVAGVASSASYVIPSISALIAAVNNPALLSATSSFQIKFQQYDNAYHGTDGRKYDDIIIMGNPSGGVGGAVPEPATMFLFGLGLAGVAYPASKRKLSRKLAKT